jgi:NACHT domain
MHDAFDFAHHEDTLKSIKPRSEQARILTLILQDVCSCCDFIQSYARESQFCTLSSYCFVGFCEHAIFREAYIKEYKRRAGGKNQGVVRCPCQTPESLLGPGYHLYRDYCVPNSGRRGKNIDSNIDSNFRRRWVVFDGFWVTNPIVVIELDAMIREIPRGVNSRFSPDKGCLLGTRVAFLDFIINWVNNPASSERGLVLFGQAGTGKSSIAHEIARQFDKMHRLTSSFIFSRREQSERKASYHLFTTLAHHLADRYPSFKTALGKVIKDNTDLRGGTRDYRTLLESLILEPLKDLHIVGPILVVIDALDESGDTSGKSGLHAFLAQNLKRLPSNFRVVITSRPEHAIVSALARAPSVKIKYMNDTELAAETHKDILTFLRGELPSDKFGGYVEALAVKAEGLFQWAAVASQLVLDPPERFDYSEEMCIKHLLERRGQDLLDELYKEVLEGYFKDQEARDLFRSVVGQLIISIEPLTIRSLITLRQHAPYNKRSDAAVTGLLHRLSSLLSNVNSSDNSLPIIPLHTSFRDFLINQDKSGDFYVGARDAHHQLSHSCLNLLLDPLDGLKFNICKLETSYLANADVEDLNTRVDQHIPPALLYACRFWDDHLKHTDFETDLFEKAETVFKEKFLFWLETLSLTRNIGLAPSAFATLNMWLASSQGVSITASLIRYVNS